METCDAIVVGGGPAGSSCAWKLRAAGLDVVVVDRATFPRDKVCAGWITPQVIDTLRLDCDEYRQGRTFQTITGFRIGLVGGGRGREADYGREVSYGIRRCEFDHYLLERSRARLRLGAALSSIRRVGNQWEIDDSIRAPMLVGAGGHFCPVARQLNPIPHRTALVAAQEAEFEFDAGGPISGERPELYFCRDLKGYGWCFRKGRYLNVGIGRIDGGSLTSARAAFAAFLHRERGLPDVLPSPWRGHAYLVASPPHRSVVGDGVILAGDAAGLAYPESGEGIRPAIESGLLAAAAILEADGSYMRERLEPYERALRARFASPGSRLVSRLFPPALRAPLVPRLLDTPWFVRRFVLDRWFLHRNEPALLVG